MRNAAKQSGRETANVLDILQSCIRFICKYDRDMRVGVLHLKKTYRREFEERNPSAYVKNSEIGRSPLERYLFSVGY